MTVVGGNGDVEVEIASLPPSQKLRSDRTLAMTLVIGGFLEGSQSGKKKTQNVIATKNGWH